MTNKQKLPFIFAREAADSIFELEKLVSQESIKIVNEILEINKLHQIY